MDNVSGNETVVWTMIGTRRLDDGNVYVIQETRGANVSERLFSTTDLHEHVDRCGNQTTTGDCRWEQNEFDFPLHPGKTWDARLRTLIYHAQAEPTSPSLWELTLTFGPVSTISIVYDESVGNIIRRTERTNSMGTVFDELVLVDCSRDVCKSLGPDPSP